MEHLHHLQPQPWSLRLTAPQSRTLLSPSSGGSVSGATKYHIRVGTDSAVETSLFHSHWTSGVASKTYTDFPNNGTTYYWKVRAYNAYGWGSWSTIRSLTNEPSPPLSEIRGSKWNDLDVDGVWDNGEPGLENWKIYLDENANGQWDSGELYDLTDSSGDYSFADLEAGTYVVAEVLQLDWTQTYPSGSPVAALRLGGPTTYGGYAYI